MKEIGQSGSQRVKGKQYHRRRKEKWRKEKWRKEKRGEKTSLLRDLHLSDSKMQTYCINQKFWNENDDVFLRGIEDYYYRKHWCLWIILGKKEKDHSP